MFTGKVALVTGAARGIGAATAQMYADHGARVILADVSEEVTGVAKTMTLAGHGVESCVGSVADPSYCEALVDLALEKFGRLDFAFNNAGIGGNTVPIDQLSIEDWRKVIDINLNAVFYGLKYQIPAMEKNPGGVIINTSSVLGLKPLQGSSIEYTAAKHGVIGLTRQIAVNYGEKGIRCNAICPGFIETPLVDDQESSWFVNRTPAGRTGKPADIANMVKVLCSDDASFVNGDAIAVDGGFVLT